MESKGTRIRFFESDRDNVLYHDLWLKLTRKLSRSPVKSVNSLRYKWPPKSDPQSRVFAFDGEKCIGGAGISPGSPGDFWTVDYPLLLKSYRGQSYPENIRSKMFEHLLGYAVEHIEVPFLCQHFREDWENPIQYFKKYGFKNWF